MKIKEFWQERSLKEQKILIIGGFFVLIGGLYHFAYKPLTEGVESRRQAVEDAESLLSWMQANQETVLHARGHKPQEDNMPLFQRIDTVFKVFSGSEKPPTLSQVDATHVSATFEKVNFDSLTKTIMTLSQRYGVEVSALSATRLADEGYASVTITFAHG